MDTSLNITKQYQSTHSAQQLYEAWISDKMVVAPITRIESDARIGGQYILHSQSPQGSVRMLGKFTDLIPNERIEYTWQWEGTTEETLITVTFTSREERTYVEVRHQGFQTVESLEMHDSGWDSYFNALIAMI